MTAVEDARAEVAELEAKASNAESAEQWTYWSKQADKARWTLQQAETAEQQQADQDAARSASRQEHAAEVTAHRGARGARRVEIVNQAIVTQQMMVHLVELIQLDRAEGAQVNADLTAWGLRSRDGVDDDTFASNTGVMLDGEWFGDIRPMSLLMELVHRVENARVAQRQWTPKEWRNAAVLDHVPAPERADLPRPPRAQSAKIESVAYVRDPRGRLVNSNELSDADPAELERRDPRVKWSPYSQQSWDAIRKDAARPDTAPERDAAERGRVPR